MGVWSLIDRLMAMNKNSTPEKIHKNASSANARFIQIDDLPGLVNFLKERGMSDLRHFLKGTELSLITFIRGSQVNAVSTDHTHYQ